MIVQLSRAAGGPLAEVAYVGLLLWTIGITIVATIIGAIVAAILAAIVAEVS
ncbi:MAG: hypothetical protein GVY29_04020 [Spirochaetes bacterium]|nr:hypothetical protein [Spirochaetota bacterium]